MRDTLTLLVPSSTRVGQMALLAAHISPPPMMPTVVLLSGKRRGCDGIAVADSILLSLSTDSDCSLVAVNTPEFHRTERGPSSEDITRDIHALEIPAVSRCATGS